MRVKKKNQLSGVLVLLVFAVFGVSVLLVLLTGADVVKTLSERDQERDRKSTRLNSSHPSRSRMPSSA